MPNFRVSELLRIDAVQARIHSGFQDPIPFTATGDIESRIVK